MRFAVAFLLFAISFANAQTLQVGTAQVVITPPAGMPMAGYYSTRLLKGVHDDLHAKAIVMAATYYKDPAKLLEASEELGIGMPGLDISKLHESELMQTRGW